MTSQSLKELLLRKKALVGKKIKIWSPGIDEEHVCIITERGIKHLKKECGCKVNTLDYFTSNI